MWLVLALLLALLAGCGQKGDLYLPDESPEDAARR
ncbi:MAG TPA: lipoprotein [Gammaproteobacteria bacterium]|nr:lipoprotein [Gammaproteobacteria bacterium]